MKYYSTLRFSRGLVALMGKGRVLNMISSTRPSSNCRVPGTSPFGMHTYVFILYSTDTQRGHSSDHLDHSDHSDGLVLGSIIVTRLHDVLEQYDAARGFITFKTLKKILFFSALF